jgi:tetratricopeptide (TPR) repeat protein
MAANADTLKDDGLRLYREGDYAEAAAQFEAARGLYADLGDQGLAGEMLNNMGLCFRGLHRWEEAGRALEEALAEFGQAGDRGREAQALGNLGALAESRGDPKRAAELYEQAGAIFDEVGDQENRAYTLKSLSAVQLKQGRHFEALATMDSSLASAPRLNLQQRMLRRLIQWPMRLLGGK